MKSYTDLEQSKKLAEILPIESADMVFTFSIKEDTCVPDKYPSCKKYSELYKEFVSLGFSKEHIENLICPCWSLAALLGVLPSKCYPIKDHETNLILGKPKDKWCALYWDTTGMQDGEQTLADNPVDACYEMIIRLNELNLL